MKNNKMWYKAMCLLLTPVLLSSCSSKGTPPQALEVVPTEHQLAWQDLEYYMFIHFGPNTFTDVEWGDGKEDPKVFNPSNVDTRQWASVAKDAGMKGIIITAKHHDGFCLWPSEYSTHTVRESLWKDGKGDILKELSESCKEFGLKFGVYLSPWDQNHPDYGTPAYNQIFANTLTEVLTNYGEVFEQWFDGASDGTKKQIYDWDMFHKVVYDNQPQAVIFSDVGPGCRWIGNESGIAGETNWSRMDIKGFEPGAAAPKPNILNEGQAEGEAWVPGEVDVSIRPGWFYSPSTDDKVKTVEHLMNIYYTSVGRNTNLLLNVPPDRQGRIHPSDSIRLMEFRTAREEAFATNLASGAKVEATNVRQGASDFSASNLVDGKKETYWATDDAVKTASLEVTFKNKLDFNRILLQEFIELGQRVAEFNIEYWDDVNNSWTELTKATTIGNKRILRFPTIGTSKIRINVTNALASLTLSNLEIYKAPEMLSAPTITRNSKGNVTMKCSSNDPVIYYTTDGTDPTTASAKYTDGFLLTNGGEVKAISTIEGGAKKSDVVKVVYDIAPATWTVSADAVAAIDADDRTIATVKKDQVLEVNLGSVYSLKGFSYTPGRSKNAIIQRYNFYVSADGKTWIKVINNVIFNNIKNSPVKQDVFFAKEVKASYIKIEPTQLTDANAIEYGVAEIGIITR